MRRKAWKWALGISIAVLILLVLFTFGLWVMANVGAVLFRILFMLDEDLQVSAVPFGAFMSNFLGSPLFYIYMADLAVLLSSSVVLTVTRKK